MPDVLLEIIASYTLHWVVTSIVGYQQTMESNIRWNQPWSMCVTNDNRYAYVCEHEGKSIQRVDLLPPSLSSSSSVLSNAETLSTSSSSSPGPSSAAAAATSATTRQILEQHLAKINAHSRV
jgi:hypothetical protein